ncbi:MAG TPA: triose-phosphate isomerase family protein [Patescibacteria group bacterium]|nr:triose-phosphate isomerase family protein [Patescibacteria group bacterium]
MRLVIANWKMNMNLSEITGWLEEFKNMYRKDSLKVDVIIAPPFPYLAEVKAAGFSAGAQDVSQFEKGAHTGEVGAFEIKDYCRYCIIGHSERAEERDKVLKKRDLCLKNRITPIVCFVEPEDALRSYSENSLLAWEDPQNISINGHYRAESTTDFDVKLKDLKKTLPEGAKVIYGGSVNRQNVRELANISELDGVLVGNASLDPAHFKEIVEAFAS